MRRFYAQPDGLFNVFKERATVTIKDRLDDIDEDIRRVVIELNELSGVAPVWSCASHPETRKVSDRKMHVICAVNQEGAEQLDQVYQEWSTLLVDYGMFHVPNLTIARLVHPDFPFNESLTTNDLYYAVELKVSNITTKRFKQAMLLSLEEAIRNVSF